MPSILSCTPNHGPVQGGTSVTIVADGGLTKGPVDVQFGGVSASNIVIVNDTTLTCTTPAHLVGTVDLNVPINVIQNPGFETAGAQSYLAANWDFGGGANLDTFRNTSNQRSGSACLRFTHPGANMYWDASCTQNITLTPAQFSALGNLTFWIWLYDSGGSPLVNTDTLRKLALYVNAYDSGNNVIDGIAYLLGGKLDANVAWNWNYCVSPWAPSTTPNYIQFSIPVTTELTNKIVAGGHSVSSIASIKIILGSNAHNQAALSSYWDDLLWTM